MTEMRKRSNFLTDIVDADLAQGKNGGKVVTRFPPEPNGFLHIGHAKSILLNFGLARQYGGEVHLRFDDTNPSTEDTEYVESIEADVRWLGGDFGKHLYFASDYFERMYDCAVRLIKEGRAYVDSQTVDAIRDQRGSFERPGTNSPFRNRPVEENLELFARMRKGEFQDGACVLRAKIDMAHPNVIMRDPLLYRIRHAHHHRTQDKWCIYPMYDYAHPLEDAFEGITHSICTLEFESNRELYDWVLDSLGPWKPRPYQYEFARLALGYTVMSKRKLLQLVQEKRVLGWDDPRMPTVAGMRRRGVTPEALRDFADLIGVAKNNSLVDIGKLEFAIRRDLEGRSPRGMAVLNPLKVELTNWPKGKTETLSIPWWPDEPLRGGSREVPFSGELYIEQEDFLEAPPKDWRRLTVGWEARLLGAYVIKCEGVRRGPSGDIEALLCTYDPDSPGGNPADKRKIPGTLHWVDAHASVPLEVRLYDRLFNVELPDAEGDFLQHLNPRSLVVPKGARGEPALQKAGAGAHFQLLRLGYFFTDPVDSAPGKPVFNRVVTLKDTWAKAAQPEAAEARAARPEKKAPQKPKGEVALRPRSSNLLARLSSYKELGLSPEEADLLSREEPISGYFDAAVATHSAPKSVAKWLLNELLGLTSTEKLPGLMLDGAGFGRFVSLVDQGRITPNAAKTLLAELVAHGGEPEAKLQALGLERKEDPAKLASAVEEVLKAHPSEVQRYRSGEEKLLGVLMGAAMKAVRGAADAGAVRQALLQRLAHS
jgi:glutaminyl-tRNA synthetase